MAKTRRKRHTYTEAQRKQILAAATREGLTANDVKKKFGVTPVTYYSWRKKTGLAARRGSRSMASNGRVKGADLSARVRNEVRTKIQQVMPGIVRSEVEHYMNALFGSRGRRRT